MVKLRQPAFEAFVNRITTNILVWGLDEEGLHCLDVLLKSDVKPEVLVGYDSDPGKVRRALDKNNKFSSAHFYSDELDHEEFCPRYWEEYHPMHFCRMAFVTVPVENRCQAILRLVKEHRVTIILCPEPAWNTQEEKSMIERVADTHGATVSTWGSGGPEAMISTLLGSRL